MDDKGTQTPDVEAVLTAVEASYKTPSDETKALASKTIEEFKAKRAEAKKLEDDAKAKSDEAKAIRDKALEEFKTKELKAPDGSLVSPQRLTAIKEYAVKNSLDEEQAMGLVKFENEILTTFKADQEAMTKRLVQAKVIEFAEANAKHPKLGGALKTRADLLINGLIEAKGTPELKKLFSEYPASQHPVFREFLLSIAEGMEPGELHGDQDGATRGEMAAHQVEFSKTASDFKQATGAKR